MVKVIELIKRIFSRKKKAVQGEKKPESKSQDKKIEK